MEEARKGAGPRAPADRSAFRAVVVQAQRALRDWVLPGARVCALGCGRGPEVRTVLGPCSARLVVGVDVDASLLASSAAAVRRAGLDTGRALHVRADISATPFRNATFDTLTAMFVLHQVPEPAVAVREMLRVSATGAHWIVATWEHAPLDAAGLERATRFGRGRVIERRAAVGEGSGQVVNARLYRLEVERSG